MTPSEFEHLAALYADMDAAYDKVAKTYDFHCQGCKDNCCTSLFFHHTHVEKAYLAYGFSTLADSDQRIIRQRADDYIKETFESQGNLESKKILCPLNQDEKCMIYAFRPMICRLHGLPYELHRPGAFPMKGPGCHAGNFHPYTPFDRTPFYQRMAQVEMEFRTRFNKTGKIKETIAQILENTD